MLGQELASGVVEQELAGVEIVMGAREREHRNELPFELGRVWATRLPEGRAVGHLAKAEHLFHAAVAVRGNDENRPGQATEVAHTDDDVVVKLALCPMLDELVPPVSFAQPLQQGSQRERLGERIKDIAPWGARGRRIAQARHVDLPVSGTRSAFDHGASRTENALQSNGLGVRRYSRGGEARNGPGFQTRPGRAY